MLSSADSFSQVDIIAKGACFFRYEKISFADVFAILTHSVENFHIAE